ncbi:hypothetical protein J2X04_000961 [Lysobacter niabensis]|uniref:Uncharacterized protein n=1 Tax=Agrilutibacter niabensis TaxID=380628 RepID=A0ABU1VMC2_9GAMM|nr:hypothetical protein [Lysobacter niabensis]MDR7098614.1 hypothetical protein [Lysobacter niabensis]
MAKRNGTSPNAPPFFLTVQESPYPEYPSLLDDDELADCDLIFATVRDLAQKKMLPDRQEEALHFVKLYPAAVLTRFTDRVTAGEDVEPFILRYVAGVFKDVLAGKAWDDAIELPGRGSAWGHMSPKDQRDFDLANDVWRRHRDGARVTIALSEAAGKACVSYETARAAYYKWNKWFSKKPPKK